MDVITLKEQTMMNKFCPCIDNPADACYCTKLDAQYNEKMKYFCSNNFELCEIFKDRLSNIKDLL
jgi:hypothetical protein